MKNHSPTYINLLDYLFKISRESIESPVYGNTLENSTFKRIDSGAKSHKFPQPIVITNYDLYNICTASEWHLIGRITCELKEYNALWECKEDVKKSSTNRASIKGLIKKGILIKTETTNIYLVNPKQIRRGDILAVITTTANMLMGESKVGIEHITNKRPVKTFDILPTSSTRPNALLDAPNDNEIILS